MLPEAIRKQVEEAKELEKKFLENPLPEEHEEEEEEESGAVTETPEETPYSETLREETLEEEEQEKEEEDTQKEDWEHKYRVLQGKYNAEVPRLNKEIKQLRKEREELRQRLQLLEQMVLSLQQQAQQVSAAQQAPAEEEEDDELKLLKENYPDVYNAITKLLEKKIAKEVKPEIEQVAQRDFATALTALVPDWEQINTDPEFLSWLKVQDELTGFTRHELLLQAYNARDVRKVARFFQAFKQYRQQQAESEEEVVSGSKKEAPAKKDTAPPHRKPAATGRRSSKKVFKQSEIERFYKDVAMGKYSPEQKASLEQEIISAVMEGRVIYGK